MGSPYTPPSILHESSVPGPNVSAQRASPSQFLPCRYGRRSTIFPLRTSVVQRMYGTEAASGGSPSMMRTLTWSWMRGLP